MALLLRKCRTCGALGVGPKAVKLWPLDGLLYCEAGTPTSPGCFRRALDWHESRGAVVLGLQHELAAGRPVRRTRSGRALDWRGYIEELTGMAGWALEAGDRRSFVHYFARAVLAWGMREAQEAKR